MRIAIVFALLVAGSFLGAQTVTFGSLTTNNTNNMAPIYRAGATSPTHWSRYATVYTNADLPGIPSGAEITGVEWFKNNAGATLSDDAILRIYLKNSTLSAYPGSTAWLDAIQGATLVYSSTTQGVPAATGFWSPGAFNGQTFTYAGNSIEVLVEWDCSTIPSGGLGTHHKTTDSFIWRWDPYGGSSANAKTIGSSSSTLPTTLSGALAAEHSRQPHLRVTYSTPSGGTLIAYSGTSATAFSQTSILLADFDVIATGANQDLTQVVFAHTGTMPVSEIAAARLWLDDGNNVFDAGDTQLAVASFAGSNGTFTLGTALTITIGSPQRLFISYDLNPTAPGNRTLRAVLLSGALSFTPGPGYAVYPATWPERLFVRRGSTLPYSFGFETQELAPNMSMQVGSGLYPTATAIGAVPTMVNRTGNSSASIVPVQGAVTPRTGDQQLVFAHASNTTGALDMHFDLSAFNVATDLLELNYYYVDNAMTGTLSTVITMNRVFISTNGGATWVAAISFMDFLPADLDWRRARIGLSAALMAYSLNYTSEMVIRIQAADNGANRFFHVDDITLDFASPELEIAAPNDGDPSVVTGPLLPGTTNQQVAAFDVTAWGEDQTLNSLVVHKSGNIADSDVAGISVWLDSNSNGFLDGADTMLGTVGAFAAGVATVPLSGGNFDGYSTRRLFVALSIGTGIASGTTAGAEIQAASSFSVTPAGAITGTLPLAPAPRGVFATVSALPFRTGFENGLPANFRVHTAVGNYPSGAVGGAITTPASAVPGRVALTGTMRSAVAIEGETSLLLHAPESTGSLRGVAAADMHLDLSAFNVATDRIDVSFMWARLWGTNVDNGYNRVFISANGGTTWHSVVELSAAMISQDTGTRHEAINLQAVLSGLALNYTSQMIVRFQGSLISNVIGYLIDQIVVRVNQPTLDVRPIRHGGFTEHALLRGTTNQLIGAIQLEPTNGAQVVTALSLTNFGNLADSGISDVNLWLDAGDLLFDPAADFQITSATANVMTGGVVNFTGLLLTVLAGQPATIFVTVNVTPAATPGASFGLELTGAANMTLQSAAAVTGPFPVRSALTTILQPLTSLPWSWGFDRGLPDAAVTMRSLPGSDFIEAVQVGEVPSSASVPQLSTPHLGGVFRGAFNVGQTIDPRIPQAGERLAAWWFGATGVGTGGTRGGWVEIHMDLSNYSVLQQQLRFSFDWFNIGISSANNQSIAALSLDGGATWQPTLFRFPFNVGSNVWNSETFDLSAFLRQQSLDFTGAMVLRLQCVGTAGTQAAGLANLRLDLGANVQVDRGGTAVPIASIDNIGDVTQGQPQQFTWTITNGGSTPLTLDATNAVSILGTVNATVTLVTPPAVLQLAPGDSTNFTVEVAAINRGLIAFQIDIRSSDGLQSPYSFSVFGQGLAPEIDVQRPAATSVPSGGQDNYGPAPTGINTDLTYYIFNQGDANLVLQGATPVTLSSPVNVAASLVSGPALTTIPTGGFTTFVVRVNPGLGAFTVGINIASNDQDESSYAITLAGDGQDVPVIELSRDGNAILHNGVDVVGALNQGDNHSITFNISNSGSADLNLTGTSVVEILDANNVSVTLTTAPQSTIAAGGDSDFVLSINPVGGSFSFRVRIATDDPVRPEFTFTVAGVGDAGKSGGGGKKEDDGCSTSDSSGGGLMLALLTLIGMLAVRAGRGRARKATAAPFASFGALLLVATVAAGSVHAQSVPQMLYYKMNEAGGTGVVNDANPGVGAASGTLNGTFFREVPGRLGSGAININRDSYIDTGWAPNLPGTQSWTIEFWTRLDQNLPCYFFADGDYTGSTLNDFRLRYEAGTTRRIMLSGVNDGISNGTVGLAFPALDIVGKWTHLAAVYDASTTTLSLYMNGQFEVSSNEPLINITGVNFLIGALAPTSPTKVAGAMDEFRMWNTARTAGELLASYQSEMPLANSLSVIGSSSTSARPILGGTAETVVGAYQVFAINTSAQDLEEVTFTRAGSAPNSAFSNLKLWHDVNGDGLLDGGDIQLGATVATLTGGGTVTFTGAPTLISVSAGQSVALILTSDTSTTGFGTAEFSIVAATNVTAAPGPITGALPATGGPNSLVVFSSAIPFHEDFEAGMLEANVRIVTAAGTYPRATAVGNTVTTSATTAPSAFTLATQTPNLLPNTGTGLGFFSFGSGNAAGGADFLFDLSAFTAAATELEFSFYWGDDLVGTSASTDDFCYVFISVDGGATWIRAAHFLNPGVVTSSSNIPWQRVRLGLSQNLLAASLDYTADTIVRIQFGNGGTSARAALDDVRLEVASLELELAQGPAPAQPIPTGISDTLLGSFTATAWGGEIDFNNVVLTKLGTVPDGDIVNIRFWADNGDGLFDSGSDTALATSGAFAAGQATINGSPAFGLSRYQPTLIFVTTELSGTTPGGAPFGVAIMSAAAITPAQGAVVITGTFPILFGPRPLFERASVLPWTTSWEQGVPANVTFTIAAGSYPTATAVGTTLSSFSTTSTGNVLVTPFFRGGVAYQGGQHLALYVQGTGTGAVAVDMHLDLSAYNVANDRVDALLHMAKNGIATSGNPANLSNVFLSVDGGATWIHAPYRLTSLGTDRIYERVLVNIQAALAAASANYSSQVVLRVQLGGGSASTTVNALALDDVEVRVTQTGLTAALAESGLELSALVPGVANELVGVLDLAAYGANQSIPSITVRNNGTAADADYGLLRLWRDDGDLAFSPSNDTPLTNVSISFSAGVASFSGLFETLLSDSSVRYFVTASPIASATPGNTMAIRVDASDIVLLSGSAMGSFPLLSPERSVLQRPAALPHTMGMEASQLPSNMVIRTGPGSYPTSPQAGAVPQLVSFTSFGNAIVAPIATPGAAAGLQPVVSPIQGQQFAMGGSFGSVNSRVVAFDYHYDLSAFDATSDQVLLRFSTLNVGMTADDANGVFISIDGGATFAFSAFRFNWTLSNFAWERETVDLTSFMRSFALQFTDRMVVRIQGRPTANTTSFYVDHVELDLGVIMQVENSSATVIVHGGFDNLGALVEGTPQSFTFTIRNNGNQTLNLTGLPLIEIANVTNAFVSVTSQPAASIAAASSTTFTLQIEAQGNGNVLMQLLIYNSSAQNPFVFALAGQGLAATIDVHRPVGTSLPSGSTNTIGTTAAGTQTALTYFILNKGGADLLLSGPPLVSISGATNCVATVIQQPLSATVSPATFATFAVGVNPNVGAFSFIISISSNDAATPVYLLTVSGTGATVPEIDIRRDTVSIPDFSTDVAGIVPPGVPLLFTYVIHNTGSADLLLTGTPLVELLDLNNVTASVQSMPAASIIPAGGSQSFVVEVTPTAGAFSLRIRVLNNDTNEGFYTWTTAGFAGVTNTGGGGGSGSSGGCVAESNSTSWIPALGALLIVLMWRKRRVSKQKA